jgi:serine/threonine protein kinase
LDKKRIPVMDDFSKIDVWALAITLINMLTLEFPFFQVHDDFENYEKFIKNP